MNINKNMRQDAVANIHNLLSVSFTIISVKDLPIKYQPISGLYVLL